MSVMQNGTFYYDFRINDSNLGFFEIRFEPDQIYQNVKFHDGVRVYENPFFLKLDNSKLTAFKKAEQEWISLQNFGENHFPSSAYPLLLPKVKDRLEYFQINEESGLVEGKVVLEKEGARIVESRENKLMRTFHMDNGMAIEIDWGGAISKLKSSLGEAIEGSPLKN